MTVHGRSTTPTQQAKGRHREAPWGETTWGFGLALLVVLASAAFATTGGPWSRATAAPLSDEAIAIAVSTRLQAAPSVPYDRLDVETQDGIVELSGTVSHLLAKDRALRLAQTIKGVRAVVDRISVDPDVTYTDEKLGRHVKLALARDPAADSYQVEVTVRDGVVTLTGQVDSWAERNLAEEVVKRVRGVREVESRVTVAADLDRADVEVKADVINRLQSDVWVNARDLAVTVEDGVVYLSGTVPSADQAERATLMAWVAGVADVRDDNLAVKWERHQQMQRSPRTATVTVPSIQAIEEAVRDALLHDPRVANFNLGVRVRNGRVILTGVVDNLKAKRATERDALNTVGVWSVKNLLKVRPVDTYTDASIAQDVRAAILHDPALDRDAVDVHVIDGTVYLTGRVESVLEKRRADAVAAGVKGVLAVVNDLTVRSWPWNRADDLALRQQIVEQLWWSPFVDSDEIQVSVEDGIATLTGTVQTWHERRTAEENAREGGAAMVRNKLKVEGEQKAEGATPNTKETAS